MPENHHAQDGPSGQHAHSGPYKDSSETAKYGYRFVYDAKRHKCFKKALRHVLKSADAARAGQHESASADYYTLSKEDEKLLRLGVCKFSMDHRWEGNLSDSQANKAANEVVVRLYRTWTSHLIYEVRYRPSGPANTLTMYEFAWEGDQEIYRSRNDLDVEIAHYQKILEIPMLGFIKDKLQEK